MAREWWRQFRAIYLTIDARSLGLFRLGFGLVLFHDLLRRFLELRFWYVNSGLLPNHTLLWRPPAAHSFSLFFTVSTELEAYVAFGLCAFVYALFLVGYRTGLAQVLALVARVSLNSRLAVLENGGDMVMDLLCLLTLPLPLGARFSLDSFLRAQPAESRAAGEDGVGVPARPTSSPIVSVAVLGLLLQLATIYYFNAAAKNGIAWRDGTAVHYALHQDKLVTWFGVWTREHLPLPAVRVLTRSVLALEWMAPVLILTPVYRLEARLVACCLLPLMHLGFAAGLNLGGFSVAMMSYFPLLLTSEHWDFAERHWSRKLHAVSRIGERVGQLLVTRLRLSPVAAREPTRRGATWRWAREGAMLCLLFAITTEVLNDNTPVPVWLRLHQPAWAHALIEYPRILQGWRMFASEPPREDVMIYVDAVTAADRQVDPYNEVASKQPRPAGDVVPARLGQSQFFVMYSDRIGVDGYAAYRTAFQEWLLAYPERTGRPEDCLLRFDVYRIVDRSPAPGAKLPTPLTRQLFMTYRAPLDGACRAVASGSPTRPVAAR